MTMYATAHMHHTPSIRATCHRLTTNLHICPAASVLQFASGAVFCQLLDAYFGNAVNINKVCGAIALG